MASFIRIFNLKPAEYSWVRKLMKKILKKNGIYDFYININMIKNYLHNMADSFPVLSYLMGKFKDELKN